ncbi:MAG TPA: cold shock domain-containing protein [Acidobacteriota bacterium]|nr:cold shock domain-containing protein [Acidobacteriota bacterium]
MPKGKVKYFNEPRGWGIISGPDDSQDVYVHYTAINMEGYKTLKQGQEVVYELARSDSGSRATKVTLVQ